MPALSANSPALSRKLTDHFKNFAAHSRRLYDSGTAAYKAQVDNFQERVRALIPKKRAILSAAKPSPIAAAVIPAPVSLVTVPSSPAHAPLAAVSTALPSLPANAPQEPSALDALMADFRNESDPAKRSEMTAQIFAERDAFEARRVAAPSGDISRRASDLVENRLPGLTAPRSVSGASALIAQMIATQDRTERSDLAARVCASLKASIGHDAAMARYASETDPAKRSDIAQQMIAAREHSGGLAELRSLIVQFEGAHSLESRAGIFSQVTRTARRCGLL